MPHSCGVTRETRLRMPHTDPRIAAKDPGFTRALIAWFCVALAAFAQLYSPQAVLPAIAADLSIDADLSAWAVGATAIGVAVAVLPWARASDKLGRIRAAKISAAAAAILGLAAPFAQDFTTFLVIRVACGIAIAGVPAIAIPAITETVQPGTLGRAVAAFVSGNALGGLAGRVLTGPVSDALGWRIGILAVSIVATLATVVFITTVPATRVPTGPGVSIARGIIANFRNPGVGTILIQGFLLMGAFTVIYNFVGFRLEASPFHLTLTQVSWLFYSYLLAAIAPQLTWRLAARSSPTAVFLGCTALVLASLPLMLSPSLPAIASGVVLFTAAFFGAHGIASGLVGMRAAGRPAASQAPALYNLSFYAGTGFFSWLGGLIYSASGWNGTVLGSAIAIAAAALLAWGYAARRGGVLRADA